MIIPLALAVLTLALSFSILIRAIRTAPVGFEDESGFHSEPTHQGQQIPATLQRESNTRPAFARTSSSHAMV